MTVDDTAAGLAQTFDAAHREFRSISSWLWEPLGVQLCAHAAPRPGERVLDACCGAGASAVPAARAVGPGGRVDAVDLADALLEHGRAEGAALRWLRFHRADVTGWRAPDGLPYDLLQCGFGVFFLPDMDADVDRLVGLLRPGGRMAVLVWAQDALTEVRAALVESATEVLPEPPSPPASRAAAQRLDTGDKLAGWLIARGLVAVRTARIEPRPPLTKELAWSLAMGTGVRRMLDGLAASDVARVRDGYLARLAQRRITELNAASLIGVGHRRH